MIYFLLASLLLFWSFIHYLLPLAIIKGFRVKHPDISNLSGFEAVNVISKEGYQLAGCCYITKQPKAIVLLLHGIGSSKESYYRTIKTLANHDISCYAFDNRGQGRSQGKYITFGHYEKEDVASIVDLIQSKHPNTPLGLWGFSLGGAIGLQALAYDKRFDFGVIESTFAALDNVVLAYQKRLALGLSSKRLTMYALKRAGQIARFNPNDIQPAKAAEKIKVAVFHAHGYADTNISIDNAYRIHKNLSHTDSQLTVIADMDHDWFELEEKAYYFRSLLQFIEQQASKSYQKN